MPLARTVVLLVGKARWRIAIEVVICLRACWKQDKAPLRADTRLVSIAAASDHLRQLAIRALHQQGRASIDLDV